MRRKEREITSEEELLSILKRACYLQLALSDTPAPYVVPLNFGFSGRSLYFHCAREGRKLDLIARNPKVAFSVVEDAKIVPGVEACRYTAVFTSLFGTGTARLLTTREEKRKGLDALMLQAGGPAGPYPDAALDATEVVEIVIETLTGKRKT